MQSCGGWVARLRESHIQRRRELGRDGRTYEGGRREKSEVEYEEGKNNANARLSRDWYSWLA
jgi:hypothetical protein